MMGWLKELRREVKEEAECAAFAAKMETERREAMDKAWKDGYTPWDAELDRPREISGVEAYRLSKSLWVHKHQTCFSRYAQDYATAESLFSVSLSADYMRPECDRWYFAALWEAIRKTVRDFGLHRPEQGEGGADKPAEKAQGEVAPTVREPVGGAEAVAGDGADDDGFNSTKDSALAHGAQNKE